MARETGVEETACPRCGELAEWSPLEDSRVEIRCPDCGRFTMAEPEFAQAMSELTEAERIE